MTVIAKFIGIDKYQAADIRDLTGARRDSTALWALFSDTLKDIDASLIVDEKADKETVYQQICGTLSNASPDDTVIISFSGHGTHNHRLVTHTTERDNLEKSTISMKEIADSFKKCKAKKILFILDCCFSGGAPARVLEDSPIPRDISNPFNEFLGEGRVLLAASNYDEVAYETPGSGHGILTKALIDVLMSCDKEQVDILSAISEIMDLARANAQKLGVVQTPVLVTGVTGGFTIPRLIGGDNYFSNFPEFHGIKITSSIRDLSKFGIPDQIINLWADNFKSGLNDLQLSAINDNRILDGESLFVVAPTSSGKTFIGEMATIQAVLQGKKAVFLFPYKALTSEKFDQFTMQYSDILGMRVIRCTGDYLDQTKPFIAGKYDIALLTYEMFLSLSVSEPSVLNQIGLIVIDEAQFIADPGRGIIVELLLTHILTTRAKGINPQIVALSAVVGNINDFDKWIGCKNLVTYERPIPLTEGVLDRNGIFQFIDSSGNEQTEQLLPPFSVIQRRNKPSSQDVIVPLVKKLITENDNEKIIIFRNQRGTAEGVANYLSQELGEPSAQEALASLPNHDLSTTSERLRTCLRGGTAFHNTNLSREEKSIVESTFRKPDGKIRVLGATSTIAAGINTPASTVIIVEHDFLGEERRKYTVAEYKNMAGRAGRVGFQEEGKSILLADTTFQRQQLFNQYVKGNLEKLLSSFDPQNIETWIIRLLAQINRIPSDSIIILLSNTYGGFLENKKNPKWQVEIGQKLQELLDKMLLLELVEQEGSYVQLTLLGRACGRSALSFDSSLRLVEFLKNTPPDNLSAKNLMAIIQALPELDKCYTPVLKRGQKESVRTREAAQMYGTEIIRNLRKFVKDEFAFYARCKRAAILWDWISGKEIGLIEQQYSTTPFQGNVGYGDIKSIADTTRFYLRSAYQIANIMFMDEKLDEVSIEEILKRLESGLPAAALNLLDIDFVLERGEYLQLSQIGIKSPDEFWVLSPESLEGILNSTKLNEFKTVKVRRASQVST
jgi:replicative superfamily II helicase